MTQQKPVGDERVQELLKPRVKMTNDYPFNKHFKVGDILTFFAAKDEQGEYWYYHHPATHQNFSIDFFKGFPLLFTELKWWEEREASEMPEYVKNTVMDTVAQVSVWEKHGNDWNYKTKTGTWFMLNNRIPLMPSTEADYLTQNKHQ